jgi:dienelactone hydrolase
VSAALVRFARLSLRLALATLLLLTFYKLMTVAPPLPSAPAAAPVVVPFPDIPRGVWDSRGRVLHEEPYVDPPLDDREWVLGEAWRAVYTSVSGVDGGVREVTGAFFVPSGTAPENGWPVVSFAHGTTGIGHNCGPSRQPDLEGYGPIVESLLSNNFAVALTDYEGLGESGSHPYLEPQTAAFNTIDAVRAMRQITPSVSARWIAVGYSQGGQAVWAANELNSYYGNDLQLQGSVALAPAVNLTGTADLVWSGSLTVAQRARFPMGIVGFGRYNPNLDEDVFLHGSAERFAERLSYCELTDSRKSTRSRPTVAPIPWQGVVDRLRDANDVKPDDPDEIAKLRDALRRISLPQRPLAKPMLVITGEQDAVVLEDWVQSAVSRSCALGGRIEYLHIPGVGHLDLMPKVDRTMQRWIADRFADKTAPSNCPARQDYPNGP